MTLPVKLYLTHFLCYFSTPCLWTFKYISQERNKQPPNYILDEVLARGGVTCRIVYLEKQKIAVGQSQVT